MDTYRFYVPDLAEQLPRDGGKVALPADESHHARAVLRIAAGEIVTLFDGKGMWTDAKVETVGKHLVTAKVSESPVFEEKPAIQLTLATAVPKGDRAEWLIEQASQLNVAAIQWLDCEHSVVKPREGGGKMDKWRRQAIEAAKQCGRAYVMDVREPAKAEAELRAITAAPVKTPSRLLWLEPGDAGKTVAEAIEDFRTGSVTAFIGPEGGWSVGERELFELAVEEGRMTRVRLSRNVLRIETACAAVAALVMGN